MMLNHFTLLNDRLLYGTLAPWEEMHRAIEEIYADELAEGKGAEVANGATHAGE